MYSAGLIALLFAVILGCNSSSKDLHEVAATPNQSPSSFKSLCEQGRSGACALTGVPTEPHHPLPILQSLTSEEQSRLVVVVPKSVKLDYFVRRPDRVERILPERFQRDFSDQAVDQLEVSGLNTKEKYELIIVGPDGELWDQRTFRSLDRSARKVKLLIVSCMDDSLADVAKQIWPEAIAQKPDVILMIGDNVYADKVNGMHSSADATQIWNRYIETRLALPVFKIPELIPVLATWDDHDYGANDSDKTFEFKEAASEVFFTFFSQKKPGAGFERGPGVSSYWSAFGTKFAFMDDRSFRTPNQVQSPEQTHFGSEQELWLEERVGGSISPVFLISGDQFFGGYHDRESFEGSHPENFKASLLRWRQIKSPLVFLSGDRHLTEIIGLPTDILGYPTIEVTSSPIHARVFPGELFRRPNPRQIVGRDGKYNYLVLELINVGRNKIRFAVSSFTLNHQLIFTKTLTVRKP